MADKKTSGQDSLSVSLPVLPGSATLRVSPRPGTPFAHVLRIGLAPDAPPLLRCGGTRPRRLACTSARLFVHPAAARQLRFNIPNVGRAWGAGVPRSEVKEEAWADAQAGGESSDTNSPVDCSCRASAQAAVPGHERRGMPEPHVS